MNATLSRSIFYLSTILYCVFLVSACSQSITLYKDRQPEFIAEEYFNGNLTAHGVLKNRSGEVTRTFNATIKAFWKDGTGTLEERFVFDDGEVQYRTWTLKPIDKNSYRATAGDVVGEGDAETAGNAMHLNYVLRIPYKGRQLDLSVDDWMYRVDENTVINESVLRKWGFRVGTIQLAIIKHPLPDKES